MGLDGASAKRTTTGVRELELRVAVEQRAEEHDNGAGPSGRFDIHVS